MAKEEKLTPPEIAAYAQRLFNAIQIHHERKEGVSLTKKETIKYAIKVLEEQNV